MNRLAVVVERYPTLSESFIRAELHRLRCAGLEVLVVAFSNDSDLVAFPSLNDSTVVLRPCGAPGNRLIPFAAAASALFGRYGHGLLSAFHAASVAARLRQRLKKWRPDWIHAHFLGLPAVVAALLASDLCVPLSVFAHARDVFVPIVDAEEICRRARLVAACSAHARDALRLRLPPRLSSRVELFPHETTPPPAVARGYPGAGDALQLLSVCRLVPKKGVEVVLRAIARMPDIPLLYRVVGDGSDRACLERLASRLRIRVEFAGRLSPQRVAEELAKADLFVLGSMIASDGDRDGVPNAIIEAMAAGVAVAASDGGGVGEVIQHLRTGWLARAGDAEALARAIRAAAENPQLRLELAARGRQAIVSRILEPNVPSRIAARLRDEIGLTEHRSDQLQSNSVRKTNAQRQSTSGQSSTIK